MAESSFDVVSSVDMQEMKNAIGQAMKEITTRFDLKGTGSNVKGTVSVLPPAPFNSVAAGTAAADNVQAITVKNTGDAPLTISAAGLQTGANARTIWADSLG